jgi:ribonuclease P protein component
MMTTAAPTFKKQERIVSNKLIETLFEKGDSQSLAAFPIRTVYALQEHSGKGASVQILISVPKKRFKHAVDRNRVKRQIRESYRKHKTVVTDSVPEGKQLLIAFIWLSDRHFGSDEIESRIVSLLRKMADRL